MKTMEQPEMMYDGYRESAVEALIIASPEPLPVRKIVQLVNDFTPSQVAKAVSQLNDGYAEKSSSFRIRELAGGYQFYILPEYTGFVEEMFSSRRKLRLSRAGLETVAIVAYRQPVTKGEIENIRGVASDGVIRTLLEKHLVTVTGRAETIGKPLQYGTTDEFLKFF
ncbi:MAG: SMC-Scp complex subunit ScpB, partial [Candidatus Zixiibacteriota bacterium]